MAEVNFPCSSCGQRLACDGSMAGKTIECPECGEVLTVPAEGESGIVGEPESEAAEESAAEVTAEVEGAKEQAEEEEAAEEETGEDEGEEPAEEAEAKPPKDDKAAVQPDSEHAHLLREGQSTSAVKKVAGRIRESLAEGETLEFIAVQRNPLNPLNNLEPACVALTNRRLIICRPKLLGRMEFEDFLWTDVLELHLSEKMTGATLSFRSIDGEPIGVECIPKLQARQLYAIAQRFEQAAREERRMKTIAQIAPGAAARGAQPAPKVAGIHSPAAAAKGDPVLRLKQLKEMFDLGLITKQDFAAKKKTLLDEL